MMILITVSLIAFTLLICLCVSALIHLILSRLSRAKRLSQSASKFDSLALLEHLNTHALSRYLTIFLAALLAYVAFESIFVSVLIGLFIALLIRRLPKYIEQEKFRIKREKIQSQLPSFIDIIALGMSAGISFDASLNLYCSRVHNELSEELKKVLQSYQMGFSTRKEALESLAHTYKLRGLQRFVDTVIEALAFGSPMAEVLSKQSSLMRKDHQSYIQEKIEKAPVKMLLPIGILILPAMLLCILGPLLATAFNQTN